MLSSRALPRTILRMPIDPTQLSIVIHPDAILREMCLPIPEVNDEVREVAARMIHLMHEAPGVGLAAPQVGLNWRMFVANHTGEPDDDHVYINPELLNPSEQRDSYEEGCLSLPDVHIDVTRPVSITIRATNLDGDIFEMTGDDLLARIWQHEYDHLDGKLIIDNMTRMDRLTNRRALKALEG